MAHPSLSRIAAFALLVLGAGAVSAQNTSCWIVPQRGVYSTAPRGSVQITGVTAGAVILEQVATTTLEIRLSNPGPLPQPAVLLVPVPRGAAVRSFTFEGAAREPTAQLLPHDEAARIYRTIVRKLRDPALLEFSGLGVVRSSLFPVPARGTQKVRLTYEHLLEAEGNRLDYVLPRSEALEYTVPWQISVRIKSKRPITALYSPSHALDVRRAAANLVSARLAAAATHEPGPFRVSCLFGGEGVAATLLACPDTDAEGGYFLLLAGLPPADPAAAGPTPIRREVTLVLDRSGSMRGEKIEQVREAAAQVIAGLKPGEAFNIISYSDTVTPFSPEPVLKSAGSERRARAYLESLRAGGGTDIHAALTEALRRRPPEGMLPLVLFLTDGLPTAGETSEIAIRKVAVEANPHERRIFTFGVGVDVNTPLLEKLASSSRAVPTFVLPGEDVEVKVGRVFRKLEGPVLAGPELRVVGADGEPAFGRILDVLPGRLPDLFEGDRLVVLGRYQGAAPITFALDGNFRGRTRTFRFTFDLDRSSLANAFVARLWASRKIGVLVDALRQAGAAGRPVASRRSSVRPPVPAGKWRELIDEVVRLSTRFGVLTEYTAFLAREGTDLGGRDAVLAEADKNFMNRAVACRSGIGSVNQSLNGVAMQGQFCLNGRNRFWDANLNRVEVTTVQQVADRAFFRRGKRWVDGRLLDRKKDPDRVVEIGTEAFGELIGRLVGEHRQGCLALRGEILLEVEGKTVLVKAGGSL